VSPALARRLGYLESARRTANTQAWDAAILKIRDSMEPEHIRFIATWMNEHSGGSILPPFRRGENWYDILERFRPPALVRALWLIMAEHMGRGAPVSLATSVAEVYLSDPDAFPVNPCTRCGYLLPARATVRPDNTYALRRGWYMGECPGCGLDNHPEKEDDRG
jgi:hypothetical protein